MNCNIDPNRIEEFYPYLSPTELMLGTCNAPGNQVDGNGSFVADVVLFALFHLRQS
jgi:hypothetical protein